jgi:plasmid stabilization system protein ParE
MPHEIVLSDAYVADFEHYGDWYLGEGGESLAWRFEESVDQTLTRLATNPTLGRKRSFQNSRLQNLRSILVEDPFGRIVLFYRFDTERVYLFRLIHGARNLSRRLLQPGNYE